MRWWRSRRAAAAAVAATSILSFLTVATPSAVAAQGCVNIPTFCAWEQPYAQGSVYNLNNPEPSPLLSIVLGGPICYDLNGARRSFVNDTLYSATVYSGPNCTGLFTTLPPSGLINEALPHYSVRFVRI